MGNFIDLTGQKFGRLFVIGKGNYRTSPNGEKYLMWNCKCDCGNFKEIRGKSLRNGETKSCGCYSIELTKIRNFKDKTGQVFGRLTVVERCKEYYISPKGAKTIKYLCRCSCGNMVIVHSSSLSSGDTISCGCYEYETTSKRRLINLIGKRFGKLVVLKRDKDYIRPNGQHGTKWECQCDCGNIISTLGNSLLRGFTVSCGCISESMVASELKQYCIEKYDAIPEYKIVRNPITGYYLPYDIFVPNNIFVEIQGLQHYYWDSSFGIRTIDDFEYSLYKDKIKKLYAEKNGIFIEIDLRKIKTVQEAIAILEKIMEKNEIIKL